MPDGELAARPEVVLDHVAVGTSTPGDGWELFAGLLGGTWAYGGHSPGFRWGQLRFPVGPKVELLTPTGGADAAFLERFLADRGPGVHHLNFIVPAIQDTLDRIRSLGVEPVGIRLSDPSWKEAFLRPSDAFGTVVQVAEQAGPPAPSAPPAGLVEPRGPSFSLSMIEQHVADIDRATRLFRDALGGEVVSRPDAPDGPVAELSWPNGARLRLVQASRPDECIAHLEFSRERGRAGPSDLDDVAVLSRRLGVSVRLDT